MSLKSWAWQKQLDIAALSIACRHKGTPIYARIISFLVVSYALSPVNLIPNMVPILGKIDDYLLIPFGITIATKLVPNPVMRESREIAGINPLRKGGWGWIFGVLFILIWLALAALLLAWLINLLYELTL